MAGGLRATLASWALIAMSGCAVVPLAPHEIDQAPPLSLGSDTPTAPIVPGLPADAPPSDDFRGMPVLPVCEPLPQRAKDCACRTARILWSDWENLYTRDHLTSLGVVLAIAAPLANTRADVWLSDRYQDRWRSADSDRLSAQVKPTGDHFLWMPVFVAAMGPELLWPESPCATTAGAWGGRSLRALFVGGPLVGALQVGLGGARPRTGDTSWQPFRAPNSVSGHCFVAAVPFLTAAAMMEDSWCRYPLYAAALVNGWSRFNDETHSTSQILLGWWIAHLAVRSVSATEEQRRPIQCLIQATERGPELGVLFRY